MSDDHPTDSPYWPRTIDRVLDDLSELPAIALEGARGVGKTSTALRRAKTVLRLDDTAQLDRFRASPERVLRAAAPVLVDEWQHEPSAWDAVRRAVDDDVGGPYLLTGSAAPEQPPTHTGAGRIVRLRMRPMALHERGIERPTVSMRDLLRGDGAPVDGRTDVQLDHYVHEVVRSGFPGLRQLGARARRRQLDSYVASIAEHELPGQGFTVRRPGALRRWMAAYGAAVATTTSLASIRRAAEGHDEPAPAGTTTIAYRDQLERAWILEPLAGWLPTRNHLRRLVEAPKHHLVDPALVTTLLGLDEAALLDPGRPTPRDGPLLGRLFESLVTQAVRVMAQLHEARVHHLRTKAGRQEVDLVVARRDGRVLAIEVKLGAAVQDRDVHHLAWLAEQLGDDLIDRVVVTTGEHAYRRGDGVAVVPAALLGP